MNRINRIVIVFLLLVSIPLMSMLFVIPHSVLTNTGSWMQDLGDQLWQMRPVYRLPLGILLALIYDAVAGLLVYLEVRRQRQRFIRVEELSGGMATLSVDSVIQQLRYRLDPLPNVIKVTPEIRARGNQVQATIDVTVTPDANVPQMATELVGRVKQVLTEDLGLSIASDPQIRMQVAPRPAGRTPASKRAPAKHEPAPRAPASAPIAQPPVEETPPAPEESPGL